MMTLSIIGVWFLVIMFMAIIFACGVLVDRLWNDDISDRLDTVAIIMLVLFIGVPPFITYAIYNICLK